MIITRTPFRISFFGGGTDYPRWYRENGGAVLATAINKCCYISVRYLPPFFDYKSRIVWSKMENVKDHSDIEHPAVKAALQFLHFDQGIVLHHDADLPARSGLGSSSAFTVGLLHALRGIKGIISYKDKLAEDAIHVEQKILKENVGCQDQVTAAYGGFNKISFLGDHRFYVEPITLHKEKLDLLQEHLLLFFTGISRTASEVAKAQVEATVAKQEELKEMYEMVAQGIHILKESQDITDFGRLLHEGWMLKKSLTDKISSAFIDDIYNMAVQQGAMGGKLLGAGGGGFLLIFSKPENHLKIRKKLSHLLYVPFRFENLGSQIVYYDPDHSNEIHS